MAGKIMYNPNITLLTEVINQLILEAQTWQSNYINASDDLSKAVANAKYQAYQNAAQILQNMMEQEFG